jgi:hypothetical protein
MQSLTKCSIGRRFPDCHSRAGAPSAKAERLPARMWQREKTLKKTLNPVQSFFEYLVIKKEEVKMTEINP